MFPLFETIKIEHSKPHLLAYHFFRMNNACMELYHKPILFFKQLEEELVQLKQIEKTKCRVVYNATHYKIETIEPYQKRIINKLNFVHHNEIVYDKKYTNRIMFKPYENSEPFSETLFIKNNLVSDTTYSNVALWNGHEWHTPKNPLLKGTKRHFYLDEKKIIEKTIYETDLKNYSKISLINAMLDLEELEILL